MAVLLKARARSTCPYGHGCCDYDGGDVKVIRRTVKRRERAAWKREVRDVG